MGIETRFEDYEPIGYMIDRNIVDGETPVVVFQAF